MASHGSKQFRTALNLPPYSHIHTVPYVHSVGSTNIATRTHEWLSVLPYSSRPLAAAKHNAHCSFGRWVWDVCRHSSKRGFIPRVLLWVKGWNEVKQRAVVVRNIKRGLRAWCIGSEVAERSHSMLYWYRGWRAVTEHYTRCSTKVTHKKFWNIFNCIKSSVTPNLFFYIVSFFI
jgi:hypothetical protein